MLSHNEILVHFLQEKLLEYFEIKQLDLLGDSITLLHRRFDKFRERTIFDCLTLWTGAFLISIFGYK